VMQATYVWAYYAWKPFYPTDLSPVYTTLVHFQPFNRPFVVSFAFVFMVTWLCLCYRKTAPFLLGGWLAYLILTVPFLGLMEHPHYACDRYSYLNGICLSALLGGVLLWVRSHTDWKRLRTSLSALCVAILATLSVMSLNQTLIWRNSITLFQHMLTVLGEDPYRADIEWRLAHAYFVNRVLPPHSPVVPDSVT
jgi:hypothetical protein